MGSMNDITRGSTLIHNGQLWEVVEHLHARTGQRKPTVKAKLKNYLTGKVIEHQFNPSDDVQFARIETKPMEYLYRDNSGYVFMDQQTYEQPTIPESLLADSLDFLHEGLVCDLHYHGEEVIKVSLPATIELEVTEAPPHIRGDTATSDYRPVTVSTGATVKVPPFISQGERIRIDTRTGEYLGRVKE